MIWGDTLEGGGYHSMGRHLEGDSMLWGILGDAKIYVSGTIHTLNFLKKTNRNINFKARCRQKNFFDSFFNLR